MLVQGLKTCCSDLTHRWRLHMQRLAFLLLERAGCNDGVDSVVLARNGKDGLCMRRHGKQATASMQGQVGVTSKYLCLCPRACACAC